MSIVTDLQTKLYSIPNEESLDDATQSFSALELIVVELETEESSGLGFTYTIGEGGTAIQEFIDSILRHELIEETAAPQVARDRLQSATTFVGREGISELAIAAIDIALWDALGRRNSTPLYELIGGEQEPVRAYQTHGGWIQYDESTLVENAEEAAKRNFAGMKIKVGRGHTEDAARVRSVRETLPDKMDLLIDANCTYTIPEARRLNQHLDVPVDWLEEPLDKGDYVGHADLRRQIDIPIALGENLYSETQFKQAIAQEAVDIVQPDVCRVGGVSGWLAVAHTAQSWDILISPHYIEPIHVHLATAFPNVPYIEHHSTVLDEVMESPLTLSDGAFLPPDRPGHGIRFSNIEQYRKENGKKSNAYN